MLLLDDFSPQLLKYSCACQYSSFPQVLTGNLWSLFHRHNQWHWLNPSFLYSWRYVSGTLSNSPLDVCYSLAIILHTWYISNMHHTIIAWLTLITQHSENFKTKYVWKICLLVNLMAKNIIVSHNISYDILIYQRNLDTICAFLLTVLVHFRISNYCICRRIRWPPSFTIKTYV